MYVLLEDDGSEEEDEGGKEGSEEEEEEEDKAEESNENSSCSAPTVTFSGSDDLKARGATFLRKHGGQHNIKYVYCCVQNHLPERFER